VIFTETKLDEEFIVDLDLKRDNRGFFARAFCQHEVEKHRLKPLIAQANIAFNRRKGRWSSSTTSSSHPGRWSRFP
jgi:dTDP-4-dehydrorhamnose 3,5-epimerase